MSTLVKVAFFSLLAALPSEPLARLSDACQKGDRKAAWEAACRVAAELPASHIEKAIKETTHAETRQFLKFALLWRRTGFQPADLLLLSEAEIDYLLQRWRGKGFDGSPPLQTVTTPEDVAKLIQGASCAPHLAYHAACLILRSRIHPYAKILALGDMACDGARTFCVLSAMAHEPSTEELLARCVSQSECLEAVAVAAKFAHFLHKKQEKGVLRAALARCIEKRVDRKTSSLSFIYHNHPIKALALRNPKLAAKIAAERIMNAPQLVSPLTLEVLMQHAPKKQREKAVSVLLAHLNKQIREDKFSFIDHLIAVLLIGNRFSQKNWSGALSVARSLMKCGFFYSNLLLLLHKNGRTVPDIVRNCYEKMSDHDILTHLDGVWAGALWLLQEHQEWLKHIKRRKLWEHRLAALKLLLKPDCAAIARALSDADAIVQALAAHSVYLNGRADAAVRRLLLHLARQNRKMPLLLWALVRLNQKDILKKLVTEFQSDDALVALSFSHPGVLKQLPGESVRAAFKQLLAHLLFSADPWILTTTPPLIHLYADYGPPVEKLQLPRQIASVAAGRPRDFADFNWHKALKEAWAHKELIVLAAGRSRSKKALSFVRRFLKSENAKMRQLAAGAVWRITHKPP